MKATFVFLVVLLAFFVEASPARKHKAKDVRHEEVNDGEEEYEWPEPDTIKNFAVPQEFVASPPPHTYTHHTHGYEASTPSSGRHHGKNHKSHN